MVPFSVTMQEHLLQSLVGPVKFPVYFLQMSGTDVLVQVEPGLYIF